MTGEDIPNGKSLRARMMTIEVREGDIDGRQLKICQRAGKEGLLATFLATWIQWLAPQRDQVLVELAACQESWKDSPGPDGMHRRTYMAKRELGFAFSKFMDFLRDEQLANQSQMLLLENNSGFSLEEVAFGQQQHVADVDVIEQFVSLLSAAFVARLIHLEDCNVPGPPEQDPRLWGFTLRIVRGEDNKEIEVWTPNGRRVGWVDDDYVYFDPVLMYGVLKKISLEAGKSFPFTEHILRKRLVERGFAIPDVGRQKNLQRITVDGERREVLKIDITKLRNLIRFPGSHADESNGSMDDLLIA